jgi:hypothetical protein
VSGANVFLAPSDINGIRQEHIGTCQIDPQLGRASGELDGFDLEVLAEGLEHL